MIRTAAAVLARAGIYTGAIAALVGVAFGFTDLRDDGVRVAFDSAVLALWMKGTATHGA